MSETIEIYDGEKLAYCFTECAGETYLMFGEGVAVFHLQVPTYNKERSTEKTSLPDGLRIPETAKAIFERAFNEGHISRDGTRSLISSFPQISASFNLGQEEVKLGQETVLIDRRIPGGIARTASVWAIRQSDLDASTMMHAAQRGYSIFEGDLRKVPQPT